MGRKKTILEVGALVKFSFAGMNYQGNLESIDEVTIGTVTHVWYRVRIEDGTLYPCRKEALELI